MAKTVSLTTITPQIAKDLLATNTNNRKISRAAVTKYARDMKEGRWQDNGQSILVSRDGVLLDGQHRLLACVQSGVPFKAFVITDLDEDVRATLDSGRKRSAADALVMAGHAPRYTTTVAAAARLALNYLRGESLHYGPSATEIFDFVERNPDISECVAQASSSSKIIPSSMVGAVTFLGTRKRGHERHAAAFCEALASGADLRDDDPRLALRNLFINLRQRTPGGHLPKSPYSVPAIIIGWNAYAKGEPLKLVRPQPNGQGRFTIPDIVGGPKLGAGVDALEEGRISKDRVKELQQEEAAEREKVRG